MEFSTFGRHVVAELYGIDKDKTSDPEYLEKKVEEVSTSCGATVLSVDSHKGKNVSSVLCLLSESHVSVHIHKNGYVALDSYTCGDTIDPKDIIDKLINLLSPNVVEMKNMIRGTGEIVIS